MTRSWNGSWRPKRCSKKKWFSWKINVSTSTSSSTSTFMAYKRCIKYGKETANQKQMETMKSEHQERCYNIIWSFLCDFVFVSAPLCGVRGSRMSTPWFWNQLEFVQVRCSISYNQEFKFSSFLKTHQCQ